MICDITRGKRSLLSRSRTIKGTPYIIILLLLFIVVRLRPLLVGWEKAEQRLTSKYTIQREKPTCRELACCSQRASKGKQEELIHGREKQKVPH